MEGSIWSDSNASRHRYARGDVSGSGIELLRFVSDRYAEADLQS
jgi:hypothetical protein